MLMFFKILYFFVFPSLLLRLDICCDSPPAEKEECHIVQLTWTAVAWRLCRERQWFTLSSHSWQRTFKARRSRSTCHVPAKRLLRLCMIWSKVSLQLTLAWRRGKYVQHLPGCIIVTLNAQSLATNWDTVVGHDECCILTRRWLMYSTLVDESIKPWCEVARALCWCVEWMSWVV